MNMDYIGPNLQSQFFRGGYTTQHEHPGLNHVMRFLLEFDRGRNIVGQVLPTLRKISKPFNGNSPESLVAEAFI